MKAKKYLILLFLLLSVPAALASWGFLLPECYGDSFMGELKYKVRLIDETPGRRIVIVGGSAAAFGVDSGLLERAMPGYSVVNFGMYAALGTAVMLDLAEKSVRAGDIVILMPEESGQTLSGFFDPAVMWQGLDGALWLLPRLPAEKLLRLAGAEPEFAASKLRFTLRNERPAASGVYRRDSFNARGDVESPLAARNVMPLLWDETSPAELSPELVSREFTERANEFARRTGADVVFAFAPVNALAVSGSAESLYFALAEALEFPVIGDPADSVMDAGWFYDTNYHLNSAGKAVFTDALIGALKAHLGDPEPFPVSLPVMPEPESAVWSEGDDSDAELFDYTQAGDGLAVCGARDSERLTVPSFHDGKPVTAILEGAFSDCASLREVVIPRNVRSVASGAFDGAAALERIVLQNEKPSLTRAGDGLLRGTGARIIVPPGTSGAYRTDYFWSVFSGRITE